MGCRKETECLIVKVSLQGGKKCLAILVHAVGHLIC